MKLKNKILPILVTKCNLCPLHLRVREVCIDGVGSVGARFVFLLDQPYADGQPPLATSKDRVLLSQVLSELGLTFRDVFFTYAVARCWPGSNKGKPKKAGITTARACSTHLHYELDELVEREIIFTMGAAASKALWDDNNFAFDHNRGALLTHPKWGKTMPVTSFRELSWDPSLLQGFKTDLKRALNPEIFVGSDWGKLNTKPTGEELRQYLYEIERTEFVASDIETTGLNWWEPQFQVTHLGVYWGDNRGVVFDPRVYPEAYELFQRAKPHVVHNAPFEGNIYKHAKLKACVMQMGYLRLPGQGLSLEALSRTYLGVEGWKGNESDWDSWALRNARDIRCTYELYNNLHTSLTPQQRKIHDDILLPSSIILGACKGKRIPIDKVHQKTLGADWIERQEEISDRLKWDYDFWGNPNSSQQVAKFLYINQGIPIPPNAFSADGNHSTDATFLAEIAVDYKEADLIRRYRQLAKLRSNYLYEESFLRADLRACGAITGRPTGKDGIQTWPKRGGVRKSFVSERGRIVSGDLSQIELVCAAIISNDSTLCEIYRTGGDVHRETCAAIIGEVTKENRDRAKPINFLLIYGGKARMLQITALKDYGVNFSIEEASIYRSLWLAKYSGIQRWHTDCAQQAYNEQQITSPLGQIFYYPKIRHEKFYEPSVREALNYQTQGTGNLLNLLGLKAAGRLDPEAPRLTLHDAVYNDVPSEAAIDFCYEWKKEWMREIEEFWPLEERRGVPVGMDTKIGVNYET